MNIEESRRRILRTLSMQLLRATDRRLSHHVNVSRSGVRRILVCRPNHRLGNLLLLTPLLVELQRTMPLARVDIVVAGDLGSDLFRAFPNVGRIHVLSRRMAGHPFATIRTVLQIRRTKYDLALDPSEASQSGRLLLALVRATHLVGAPRRSKSRVLESTGQPCAPAHMAQWPVSLLRRALPGGLSPAAGPCPNLTIHLSRDERRSARRTLDGLLRAEGLAAAGIVVGVFADATGAKRYDANWWQRFIVEIRARHPAWSLVEIAPPDGHSRLSSRLPVFSSPSPREVAAIVSMMTCFVCADCGVMHLASASGTPTIGLFRATDAAKYGPYGALDRAIDTRGMSPGGVAGVASRIVEAACPNARRPNAASLAGGKAGAGGHGSRRDQHGPTLPVSGGCGFASG
jgi:ADP-heptose:LPS heptosyltransferase